MVDVTRDLHCHPRAGEHAAYAVGALRVAHKLNAGPGRLTFPFGVPYPIQMHRTEVGGGGAAGG